MTADPNEPSNPFSFKPSKGQLVSLSATEHAGPARVGRKLASPGRMRWKWIAAGFVAVFAGVVLAWQVVALSSLQALGPARRRRAR